MIQQTLVTLILGLITDHMKPFELSYKSNMGSICFKRVDGMFIFAFFKTLQLLYGEWTERSESIDDNVFD